MKAQVEDKFYTAKQYGKLTRAQKAKLKWLRGKRSKDGSNKKHKGGQESSQISALASQVESMAKSMGTMTKAVSKMKKAQKAAAGNRDHPALTPKKKKKVTFQEESSSSSDSD